MTLHAFLMFWENTDFMESDLITHSFKNTNVFELGEWLKG
jgi:hypothetical protein